MIRGLPDRPLSAGETLRLSHEREDLLVIPATPNSIVGDDGAFGDIGNVLVFTANIVASLAYTDGDGWTVVAKATDPSAFEDVLDSLIEFRGDSLADEDRDEIVETIAEAYETFTNRTLR
ncbi:hypothetical protein BRD00_05935 [Halobacteriales archaeon QS_8_69_26]|nr:MAG: hypothetical protein BRD00_05935 [Halobacteriales archaeon QS_8_69_26]